MDTTAIHDLAARVRHTAALLREEADALGRRVEAVPWQGRAAEAMRVAVGLQVGDLARASLHHDDAAEALEAHAVRVAETAALLPALGGIGALAMDVL